MSHLYLARKNYEKILGPMTAEEVGKDFHDFLLAQDTEICGSTGPWIRIEQEDLLKSQYPDIYRHIYKKNPTKQQPPISPSPAGARNPLQPVPAKQSPPPTAEMISGTSKNRSTNLLPYFLLGCLLIMGVLLVVFAVNKEPSARELVEQKLTLQKQIEKLHKSNGLDSASQFLFSEKKHALKLLENDQTFQVFLLPYLRNIAFHMADGTIDGFDDRLLRGGSVGSFLDNLSNCSLSQWSKAITSFFESADVPNHEEWRRVSTSPFGLLLLSDKHWLLRRFPKGWLKPQNYHLGCLNMANKAWQKWTANPKNDVSSAIKKNISDRLGQLMTANTGNIPKLSLDNLGWLGILTCFENALTIDQISECSKFAKSSYAFTQWSPQRENLQILRLLLTPSSGDTQENLPRTQNIVLSDEEPFTRLDLRPEKYLLSLFMQNKNLNDSIYKASLNFPEIVF